MLHDSKSALVVVFLKCVCQKADCPFSETIPKSAYNTAFNGMTTTRLTYTSYCCRIITEDLNMG